MAVVIGLVAYIPYRSPFVLRFIRTFFVPKIACEYYEKKGGDGGGGVLST